MPRKEKTDSRTAPKRGGGKTPRVPAADTEGSKHDAGEPAAADAIEAIKRRNASRKIRDCVQIKHRQGQA